ncbi:MAG: hypothetical protein KME32_11745 [Mojavia pulchra JT2-VF2]|jgi:hypothetical protein|uniref:Uncharacterized protein n=1 Tax=Mojavia pulchra JT2-VF2 TaxID=287848 RepID=A0A951PXP6_9NOST|nr:hypothetical protein [Mojavia pulchra JT2-VF2]
MSNINQQSQDPFAIPGVSNLDQESAAAVSGGALLLSDGFNNRAARRRLNSSDRNLGSRPGVTGFNNKASWYEVTGLRDWIVYTGKNYTGNRRRLIAGTAGNFSGVFNNNIESARRV